MKKTLERGENERETERKKLNTTELSLYCAILTLAHSNRKTEVISFNRHISVVKRS